VYPLSRIDLAFEFLRSLSCAVRLAAKLALRPGELAGGEDAPVAFVLAVKLTLLPDEPVVGWERPTPWSLIRREWLTQPLVGNLWLLEFVFGRGEQFD